MTSRTYDILSNNRDPKTVLENVAEEIQRAEASGAIPKDLQEFFNTTNNIARSWGTMRGEVTDITPFMDCEKPAFRLTFSYEDYCRGCYMGTETFDLIIPDELVQAYEDRERGWESEDWEADGVPEDALDHFNVLLTQYIANRVVAIQAEYEAANKAAAAKARQQREAQEAKERAQLAELQAKYKDS